jgi:ATP-dependent helicase HrpA
VCIRLYAEDDYLARPEFTEPEILRTNLASVILQMASIGLGDVAAFPFVDPPDARNIRDGVLLLEELGALDPGSGDGVEPVLTPLGRRLAQLPVDPRLGRMVLEADRNGCAQEVMILAAALSLQDPRERPLDKRAVADELHARFEDPGSDFLGLLNLWRYLQEQQDALSSSQFRRLCRAELLNYLRVREWQDVYGQLRQVTRSMGIRRNAEPAEPDRIHRSLLAGLLSHLGMRDEEQRDYAGARGSRFAISPGSALFKKPPRWVMAAELVETTRTWARVAARIQPEWAEKLAGDLVKRSYGEAWWDAHRGAAMTLERATLYGLPVVTGRRVNVARVDPELAREMFIGHALVEGDWETGHAFLAENRRRVEEVQALEDRARRPGIVVDEQARAAFYDERVPASVASGPAFDRWWNQRRGADPELLTFPVEFLRRPGLAVSEGDFPLTWSHDDLDLELTYRFEPGAADDGVTVHVPLAVLNRIDPAPFEWHVPGRREELVTALIRSLPKPIRKNFVPAPDVARSVVGAIEPSSESLLLALGRELTGRSGIAIPHDSWRLDLLPDHLRVTFRVEDDAGTTIAAGKDLEAIRGSLRARMRASIAKATPGLEVRGAKKWAFGTIARSIESQAGAHQVSAFPALVDEGDAVGLRVVGDEAEQARSMWAGTRRLLQLTVASPLADLQRALSNDI